MLRAMGDLVGSEPQFRDGFVHVIHFYARRVALGTGKRQLRITRITRFGLRNGFAATARGDGCDFGNEG